jgi:hypothetical protein
MEYLKTKVAYKVFVYNPNEWTSINGIERVELKFREDMPERMPFKARPIPAKLIEQAKPEFDKLCEYYLTPCTSPCTSPMVIAPKATAPFVRICGDIRRINTCIVAQSDHIPAVRKEIEKARNFSLFNDADLHASFHQIPLAEYSSQRLAIQTVWGTFVLAPAIIYPYLVAARYKAEGTYFALWFNIIELYYSFRVLMLIY